MSKLANFPSWKNIDYIIFDFDGIFTNNKLILDQNNIESVICDRSDGLGFDILRKFCELFSWKVDLIVLSKEKNKVVSSRCKKLGIKCFQGIDDKLKFIEDKYDHIYNEKSQVYERLAYLGNDLNDLKAIEKACYSIAPIDSHQMVKKYSDFVLDKKGGDGFVRSFIEEVLLIDKMDKKTLLQLL